MKKCISNISCREKKILLFEKNGYQIMDCIRCNRRFAVIRHPDTHLSLVYSDEYFFEGKDGYPNYLAEKDILFKSGIRYANIINKFTRPGKVLDVGCAAGFILKGFESKGWEAFGIEPNKTMANYGKNELHLNIQTGSIETYNTANTFDLITLIQVIGHLYDIDASLRNISRLTNQNGLVLVESWNMNSIIARIFGKKWHEYSPPSVINWFSNKSLINLFKENGFEKVDSGFPVKKIVLKHAFSLIEKDRPKNNLIKYLFNYLISTMGNMVIYYPPVDVKWYLFRKI
jgi:SAM-dependent methyltransferase